MTREAKSLLEEALFLSEGERADLAGALLKSIEPAAEAEAEAEVEAAWKKEVAARMASLDSGEVETIPWEEVRDRLRARLGAQRAG